MWVVIRLVVVAAIALDLDLRVTAEPEGLPDYMKCAQTFYNKFHKRLTEGLTSVEQRIEQVSQKVDTECFGQGQYEQGIVDISSQVTGMATLLEKMEAMEAKLNQMQDKLNVLDRFEDIATKQDINGIQTNMNNMLIHPNAVDDTTTMEEVKGVVRDSVQQLTDVIVNSSRDCASNSGLNMVLDKVVEVSEDVQLVANETAEIKQDAKICTEQGASQLLGVEAEVAALKDKLQVMGVDFVDKFASFDQMMEEIVNFTRLPPPPPPPTLPPPTTTTTTPRPVYPCEDSTFQGTTAETVCGTAARYNKCHLQTVAFHCCHTCTSLKKLPEMGSWRYEDRPRVVGTLDILRFYSL